MSPIEAKLCSGLVGGDVRWFHLPPRQQSWECEREWREIFCSCTFERFWKGTFCMFEAEMDSPDRRVILHSLGFGWGEGGELIPSRSFVGPSSSPPPPPWIRPSISHLGGALIKRGTGQLSECPDFQDDQFISLHFLLRVCHS